MILLVDHFDSFVYNQARYLQRLGVETHVERCDVLTVERVRALRPAALVLSPGPCTPAETGATQEIVRTLMGTIPMLGICLGHQTLAVCTGGTVIRAPQPCHGRSSSIMHDGRKDFVGIPQCFQAARYHSLIVQESNLPRCWERSAHTPDGLLMAMRHRELPLFGWQFHPESVLTSQGYSLLANFLQIAGLSTVDTRSILPEVERSHYEQTRPENLDDWSPPPSRDGISLSF
ncbi:MAG: aminodeoxychorismate/anthranilate synthase component II [Planctomycetota bacterium]|nr:aminodeoxychorismate/anthranilate synthase component II [Planctomycetota bacterium]MDA1179007.1 aminodeoxychorismate/anthranilate synthase component II [Planctomycetota bacterium]